MSVVHRSKKELDARKRLVEYLIQYQGKPDGKSWIDLENHFEIETGKRAGDRAKSYWSWYLSTGKDRGELYPPYLDRKAGELPSGTNPDTLTLKSRWQTQGKGGEIIWLESFKNDESVEFQQHLDYLIKSFEKAVSPIHAIKLKKPKVSNEKALQLYTSDKHIGAHTKESSMYENRYNPKEVRKRFQKLMTCIEEEVSIHGSFDLIHLVDLGDPVDGFNGYTTRGGHKLPQNLDNREQFDTYVNTHIEFFDWLVKHDYAKRISFTCATNCNHGGSFGYMGSRAIEIYLNAKYPEIETRISSKFMFHVEYGNHVFIYTHGKDEEDLKHGLPLHLNPKAEDKINNYIDYHKLYDKHVHLIKGDLHQSSTEYARRFRYKNVMSFYGASKWIHTNFGPSEAGVDYEIVYAKRNKVTENRLIF